MELVLDTLWHWHEDEGLRHYPSLGAFAFLKPLEVLFAGSKKLRLEFLLLLQTQYLYGFCWHTETDMSTIKRKL